MTTPQKTDERTKEPPVAPADGALLVIVRLLAQQSAREHINSTESTEQNAGDDHAGE